MKLHESVDRFRLICEAKERVTFGKLEGGSAGNPAEANIYLDGKDAGTITADVEDVSSGMSYDYRVSGYSVEIYLDLPNGVEWETNDFFEVKRDVHGDAIAPARKILARAKRWARDQITPKLKKLKKGVQGPLQRQKRKRKHR